jgi:hypothetical protein
MSEATPAPRPPQAFKWTQKLEMQFIHGMGKHTGTAAYVETKDHLTDWDRLLYRRRLLLRYIDALDKRAKWEPGIKRAPLRAEAIKVLEQVRAAIREAEA